MMGNPVITSNYINQRDKGKKFLLKKPSATNLCKFTPPHNFSSICQKTKVENKGGVIKDKVIFQAQIHSVTNRD